MLVRVEERVSARERECARVGVVCLDSEVHTNHTHVVKATQSAGSTEAMGPEGRAKQGPGTYEEGPGAKCQRAHRRGSREELPPYFGIK